MNESNEEKGSTAEPAQNTMPAGKRAWVSPRFDAMELRLAKTSPHAVINDGVAFSGA